MIKISILTLGHIKHHLDIRALQRWKSTVFEIIQADSIAIMPDGNFGWQAYTDNALSFVKPGVGSDITIAITEYALEDNFYLRRLEDNVVVLSLHETANACEWEDVPLVNFILRNIYELCVIQKIYKRIPNTSEWIPDIIHDETRSCIFDMCGNKMDVVYSASNPRLCRQCRGYLESKQITNGLLISLSQELRKIRKPLFYRIADFVKSHPVYAILITFMAGIATELIGSYLYDLLSK